MTMKLFNFLSKKARDCKIWSQRPQFSLIIKIHFSGISFIGKLNDKASFPFIVRCCIYDLKEKCMKSFFLQIKWRIQRQLFKDAHQNRCSWKFRKFHKKTPVLECFINKVAGLRPATLFERDSKTQVFSCETCKVFKNTYFKRTPPVTVS